MSKKLLKKELKNRFSSQISDDCERGCGDEAVLPHRRQQADGHRHHQQMQQVAPGI